MPETPTPVHRLAILLLIGVLLSGCTASRLHKDADSRDTRVRVEYVDTGNQTLPPRFYPRRVILEFGHVSGAIFGNPARTPLLLTRLSGELQFTLDLRALKVNIAEAAAPLASRSPATRGLVADPPGARIARISTFPYNGKTLESLGGGGFVDPHSRNHLILLYTDTACTIRGTLRTGDTHTTHDIVLPEKGLHWLEVQETAPGHLLLKRRPSPDTVIFSIHLPYLRDV